MTNTERLQELVAQLSPDELMAFRLWLATYAPGRHPGNGEKRNAAPRASAADLDWLTARRVGRRMPRPDDDRPGAAMRDDSER